MAKQLAGPWTFWKASNDGEEISWSDDRTMAFRPELTPIVQRLAREGLPPFDAILLLLAACRNNWGEPPSRRGLLAGILESHDLGKQRSLLWEVCDRLQVVHTLPADLRQSLDAKVELAAMVFESPLVYLDIKSSQSVAGAWERGFNDEEVLSYVRQSTPAVELGNALTVLLAGLARVDETALRSRLATGLEETPRPAPVEAPPPSGRAWLTYLEQQEDFAGLARLARRLQAVANLPRHLHDADELPVGGVTDISPRGPLDRLLLSELAYDDLTLAVRVATNEALYLRRESPPKTPPRSRYVLVDAGLRLWGLPRLFASAVALALAAHDDTHLAVSVHRAAGVKLAPIAIDSIDGLREHLAALDHRLHPAEALPALAKLLEEDEGADAVLITSADTLADPAFARALDVDLAGTLYLAIVSRSGKFELLQSSRAGRKRIAKAELSLEEILEQRPAAVPLREPKRSPLPAIFGADPFPLRMATHVRPSNSWLVHEFGVWTLDMDGRLLRWDRADVGARQIALDLPMGRILAGNSRLSKSGDACLVVGRQRSDALLAVWLSCYGTILRRVPLKCTVEQVCSVCIDDDLAYVHSTQFIEAIDLRSGDSLGRWLKEATRRYFGYYVQHLAYAGDPRVRRNRWARLTVRDGIPGFSAVSDTPLFSTNPNILRMFDCRNVEGPVGILSDGNILLTATGETRKVDHRMDQRARSRAVSRDGCRYLYGFGDDFVVVHTSSGEVALRSHLKNPRKNAEAAMWSLDWRLHVVGPPTVMKRIERIGVTSLGDLVFVSPNGKVHSLYAVRGLKMTESNPAQGKYAVFRFIPWEHDDIGRIRLARADLGAGFEAVLDSRGLLHLRSDNPNIAEVTIVLCPGESAGWTSDGKRWGPTYYLGENPQPALTPVEVIARNYLNPYTERLRCSAS